MNGNSLLIIPKISAIVKGSRFHYGVASNEKSPPPQECTTGKSGSFLGDRLYLSMEELT
jgi:hypothetical protein